MKTKTILLSLSIFVILFLAYGAIATSTGAGISSGVEIYPNSTPYVFQCGSRIILDDEIGPGRVSGHGEPLTERFNNYIFEGEQLKWEVLVLDANGIDKIEEVYVTVGEEQGLGNPIEVDCIKKENLDVIPQDCNMRVSEEELYEFNPEIMAYYDCTLTIETPNNMYGENWITIEVKDIDGPVGIIDESGYWFLNPIIALSISNDTILFNDLEAEKALAGMGIDPDIEPESIFYSEDILVQNAVDQGSGVLLDMFISGEDFYDNSGNLAFCPEENKLSLDKFSYYAQNGDYNTEGTTNADNEGYRSINYSNAFQDSEFYDSHEIIPKDLMDPYYIANILQPEQEMSINFKLDLPELCRGNFNSGSIYFWAEAI